MYNDRESMRSKSTAVVVNWNGKKFLEPLINSLMQENIAEIIVVDNHSADASLSVLRTYSEVRLICNDRNVGFGSAANQGFERVRTPYVLLLNVDTSLIPGCVRKLEQRLEDDTKVAAVAPRVVFPGGKLQPSCRSFPTIPKLFLYLSFLDRFFPSGYILSSSALGQLREVDQPMGAAIMFRMSVLQKVGMFDPRFLLYMEDVDLCERIKRGGFRILYDPSAEVIHHAGGSSNQNWERSQEEYFRSVIRYFEKRKGRLFLLRCALSASLFVRAMGMLVAGRFGRSVFYFRMVVGIHRLR